jgi:hypothetical protein
MSGENRWAGSAYRDRVVDYLQASGYVDAERSLSTAVRVSEHLREDLPDIVGVPDLALMCSSSATHVSEPLVLAKSSAEAHGLKFYGYAKDRRGRTASGSYFVTELGCLVDLLDAIKADAT